VKQNRRARNRREEVEGDRNEEKRNSYGKAIQQAAFSSASAFPDCFPVGKSDFVLDRLDGRYHFHIYRRTEQHCSSLNFSK
jgi:hypothetical protein